MARTIKTPYAVLGMLSIAPMSGYEMGKFMRESTTNFWSESDGQLYPTLAKLLKHEFISCEAMSNVSSREKKLYNITPKGMTELKQWLSQENETQSVRNEFMLKFFFGGNAIPAANIEHVQIYRYQAKSMLAQLHAANQQFGVEEKKSPHFPYWQLSIQYGIELTEAKIRWCDAAINILENIETIAN